MCWSLICKILDLITQFHYIFGDYEQVADNWELFDCAYKHFPMPDGLKKAKDTYFFSWSLCDVDFQSSYLFLFVLFVVSCLLFIYLFYFFVMWRRYGSNVESRGICFCRAESKNNLATEIEDSYIWYFNLYWWHEKPKQRCQVNCCLFVILIVLDVVGLVTVLITLYRFLHW